MATYRVWYNDGKKWIPTPDAWALYDGGWRAGDAIKLMQEGADEEEAAEICEAMQICSDIIEQKRWRIDHALHFF